MPLPLTIRSTAARLRVGQLERLRLAGQLLPLRGRRLLLAPLRRLGRDERERAGRRRAVVVGDPERELDERRREPSRSPPRSAARRRRRAARRASATTMPRARERPNGTRTIAPTSTSSRNLVRELARHRARGDERDRPMRTATQAGVLFARSRSVAQPLERQRARHQRRSRPGRAARFATTSAMFIADAEREQQRAARYRAPRNRYDDQPLLRACAAGRRGEERRQRVDDLREQRVVHRRRARRNASRKKKSARQRGRPTRAPAAAITPRKKRRRSARIAKPWPDMRRGSCAPAAVPRRTR